MQFKAQILAHADSSYDGKKGRVNQETFTALDADAIKMLDTVDCVCESGLVKDPASLIGKTVTFNVTNIRPSNTMRLRFVVKSILGADGQPKQ